MRPDHQYRHSESAGAPGLADKRQRGNVTGTLEVDSDDDTYAYANTAVDG